LRTSQKYADDDGNDAAAAAAKKRTTSVQKMRGRPSRSTYNKESNKTKT